MISENFDIEFQSRFDELMKARRASVGEIRVHSNGVKYQKQPDGSWKPVKGQNVQFSPKKDDDYFGRNYFRYAGKPKEAIEFLLKNEKGQVRKAYTKDGLGEIDIVYGNNKKGLCHIEKRHLKNQNDFESREDMAQKIADALKYGKVEKDKKDVLIIYNEIRLIISQTVVYDDEDNFRNKHWILTSYNQNIPIKDKLRKAVSEETALEKSRFYPSSETPTFNRNGTERSLTVISSKDLSLPKDTTNMNDMQQFVDEIIEKSKKGASIGTERTYSNGKTYIKTENGWKPKSGAKKAKKEDDQTDKTSSKVNDVNSYASKASDEQLQAAINDKDALPEVKQAAQEELNKRNPKEENNSNTGITDALQRLLAAQEKGEIDLGEEVLGKIKDKLESQKQKKFESLTEETLDKKLDKLKEDITSKIDEKLNELNGFKKITQTYVKQDGKTIVIKMKGDNQYKASSPGFKLESKPYESLVDFKKRIKEEFNKQFSKIEDKEENNIQDQEKDKKTILNFKDKEEYKEYVLRRNSEKENLTKDQIDRFNKAFIEYENDIKDFPEKKLNEIKSYIESQNFNKILHVYSGFTPDSKMVLNRELINQGYLPIANGMLYSIYNNKKYKHFDNQDDKRKFYYAKKSTPNLVEKKALEYYMDMGYNSVRAVNIGKEKNTTVEQISSTISSFIDKNPIKDNVVLNRRMSVDSDNINNLNQWLEANVGDVIEDKSFTSFSLDQISSFGNDIQITLLAKKGDKISNINNDFEYEYLVQKNSKYKVIAKGTNSIVVELV
mgnify:FL=1|jgi:hypothetical protein